MDEDRSQAGPAVRTRAQELAEEHDLHVLQVTLRGELDGLQEELRRRVLAEAAAEARGLVDAEGRPVWWVESDDDATLVVLDGLAMDIKQVLVELEDSHELGAWFNLDLVTEHPDGSRHAWHHSPMRPAPRPLRGADELRAAVEGYDWS